MENALLIGLSRQMTLRRELDIVANNIANLSTAGFKADRLLLEDHAATPARANAFPRADRPVRYVIDSGSMTDFAPGGFDRSDNPLDLALQGEGFFAVRTAQGERYTRAGAFQLNTRGELVTPAGDLVLAEGGPIAFTPQDGEIAIGADGTISTREGVRGRLRIVRFEQLERLTKEAGALFAAPDGAAPLPAPTVRVIQGAVERSNTQPILEMARLIEITRAYETVSRLLDRTQDLRRTAIERLAQIS